MNRQIQYVSVELPFSKNQIRKLGDRLRSVVPPDENDLDQLHELLTAYDESLLIGVTAVRNELQLNASPRLKNTGTIIEKLQRNRTGTLGNIQDLAGMRIVLDSNDRLEQDSVRDALINHFSKDGPPPRVTDRRAAPVQGYRAVHVIVYVDGLPIEVQVRTSLQHDWGEYFEKLGDYFGREIRYGEPLRLDHLLRNVDLRESDRAVIRENLSGVIAELLKNSRRMSALIDRYERLPSLMRRSTDGEKMADEIKAMFGEMNEAIDAFARKQST